MYPYIESMALREHLFVKLPKRISHLGLALALRFHLLHHFTRQSGGMKYPGHVSIPQGSSNFEIHSSPKVPAFISLGNI